MDFQVVERDYVIDHGDGDQCSGSLLLLTASSNRHGRNRFTFSTNESPTNEKSLPTNQRALQLMGSQI